MGASPFAEMDIYGIFVSSLLFLLDLISSGRSQYSQGTCDWTIWDATDEPKGVRTIFTLCSEGRVQWRNPYGDLRLFLQPPTANSTFEACFKASARHTTIKISLDEEEGELRTLVILDSSNPSMQRELCFKLKDDSVMLYLESVADMNPSSVGYAEIDYDIQKIRASPSLDDDTEDCRPCTEEEILRAVCIADFVVTGSVHSVVHWTEHKESQLHLHVDKVFRQRHSIFKRSTNSSRVTHRHGDSGHFQGSIITSFKCHVKKGHEQDKFYFIGRTRLRRAFLQCAPREEEFQNLWTKAVQQENTLCVLD